MLCQQYLCFTASLYGCIFRHRHKTPHIHAFYADDEAVFDLTGEIIAGDFPKKQSAYVKAWCLLHEDELQANWKLAKNGEEVYKIEPLR